MTLASFVIAPLFEHIDSRLAMQHLEWIALHD